MMSPRHCCLAVATAALVLSASIYLLAQAADRTLVLQTPTSELRLALVVGIDLHAVAGEIERRNVVGMRPSPNVVMAVAIVPRVASSSNVTLKATSPSVKGAQIQIRFIYWTRSEGDRSHA
jgi:hypothetical protein